ncbi:MAG: sigma-E processing peptidase SpoIIGA [Oscillospiraceae bacterium]|nr:sigma-E processing peptidase SpoIIGA [Oscillospiraceae bacterium]MDY5072335.1 sigma-E processing peptidase SpoIIGA [Oscillospiraceae bacterium]
MSNVIYVDILLMINLLVNFLMLSAAGLLVKTPMRSWRILLSAAIGAVYSLIIFLPDMNLFFSIALRVICFAAMLFTAFSIRSVKDFLRAGGGFLMANFAFAGITLAIWLIFKPDGLTYKNGAVYFDISAVTLLLTSAACYAVIRLISYFMRRNAPDSHTATVRIDYRGKEAECAALIDTGSSLKEPFSSYPAIVFEYSAIASVLPDEIKELVRREIKEDEAYACRGVRFISFRSVGGSGLLPAIKIDKATVKTAKGIFSCSETYAAIYNGSLSGGEYSALIGNNFFDRAERGGSKNEKAESGNTKTDKPFSQPQRPGRGTLHKRLRDTARPAEKR